MPGTAQSRQSSVDEMDARNMDDQAVSQVVEHNSGQQPPVRRRLGRGLNALLGGGNGRGTQPHATDAPPSSSGTTDQNEIHVELIEPNPFQPRKDFDEEALTELADSVRIHGVLQPLLVRPHGAAYQLIAGERRLMASRKAGLETVPCRVVELDDQRMCEAAIEENMKRKDLGALEKARAFREYIDRFGCTIEELGRQLSLGRSTVSNLLRLLDLPAKVRKALAAEQITNGHARALLPLNEQQQLEICRQIQRESLNVRQTEELVRSILKPEEPAPAPEEAVEAVVARPEEAAQTLPVEDGAVTAGEAAPAHEDSADEATTIPFPGTESSVANDDASEPADQPASRELPESTRNHVESVQQQLRDDLGLKVDIRLRSENSGQFVLTFGTHDEFEQILALLRRTAG